ncbi:MAG: bifunctional YncE family protein/alkaline phosphatase family protein, partial [Mycobacteriales bacterium]
MRRPAPAMLRASVAAAILAATALPFATGAATAASNPLLPATYRMPNGSQLTPAGRQVLLPKGPTGLAVSPDGATVYAVTSGLFDENLVAVNTKTLVPTLTTTNSVYLGVAANASGEVWAAGGSSDRVYAYHSIAGAAAAPAGPLSPAPGAAVGGIQVADYPGSLLLGPHGDRLYAAGNISQPGGGCPSGQVCSLLSIIENPTATSPTVHTVPVGRDAYGMALDAPAGKLFVTNWADATVSELDVATPGREHVVATIPVGSQPAGIAISPDHRYLAVADSNSDSLTVLTLDRAGNVRASRSFDLRVTPQTPLGVEPVAVAYAPDGRLYVSEGGLNAVEVRAEDGRAIPEQVRIGHAAMKVDHTWIPTGWFPDALAVSPHGGRLYVANNKGMGAGPGGYYDLEPLTGTRTEGSLSAIDLRPKPTFNRWTAAVVRNDQLAPLFDPRLPDPASNPCLGAPQPNGTVIASQLLCAAARGKINPRQLHVVFVVNENKTFDSYFGDIGSALPGANANPAFTSYGQAVTPNQHAIAETWNVSDNFWSNGDVSSEGHQWLTAGYETLHDQLLWGAEYDEGLRGSRGSGQYSGQLQGSSNPAVAAVEASLENPRTRIFDEIANPKLNPLGITQRIYSSDLNPGSAASVDQVPLSLWGFGPHAVGGKDITFPDVDRAAMFLHGQTVSHAWNALAGPPPATFGKTIAFSAADKAKFTLDGWTAAYKSCRAAGGADASSQTAMPTLRYLNFPENHTYVIDNGFNPLDPTPQSMVADNDVAMGELVAGLSKSPFWKNTLFVLTQDDVQYVGDHVDAHRDFLLAAGGLARQLGPSGQAAHQVSSFPSILKTIEVLFHLPAMTLFDARAVPLDDILVPSLAARNDVAYTTQQPAT